MLSDWLVWSDGDRDDWSPLASPAVLYNVLSCPALSSSRLTRDLISDVAILQIDLQTLSRRYIAGDDDFTKQPFNVDFHKISLGFLLLVLL